MSDTPGDPLVVMSGVNKRFGSLHVLYGQPGGLLADGSQLWWQDAPDVEDVAEPGDAYGERVMMH